MKTLKNISILFAGALLCFVALSASGVVNLSHPNNPGGTDPSGGRMIDSSSAFRMINDFAGKSCNKANLKGGFISWSALNKIQELRGSSSEGLMIYFALKSDGNFSLIAGPSTKTASTFDGSGTEPYIIMESMCPTECNTGN